jgi:hypothetical protein
LVITSDGLVKTRAQSEIGITGITASNGLTANTSTNVKLGGTLTDATTTINAGTNRFVGTSTFTDGGVNSAFTFNNTLATGSLTVGVLGTSVSTNASSAGVAGTSSSSGVGVIGTSTSGAGVYGSSSSGIAGNFRSTSGTGVTGFSNNSIGGDMSIFHSSTNTTREVLRITRNSSGTGATGLGGYISYLLETDVNTGKEANQLLSKWTDATDATRTSQFEIWGVNSAVLARKLAIAGSGKITADTYGVGTHTGTVAYAIGVTATGELVEYTASVGSGSTDSIVFEAPITLVEGAGSDPDTVRLDTANFVTGNLNIIGGQQVKRTLVTSDLTLTYNHFYIAVDASGGNVTVTLPAISGRNQAYRIKRIDNSGNTVTISAGSGQTIDGAASTTLTSLQSKYVIADGSTNYELN